MNRKILAFIVSLFIASQSWSAAFFNPTGSNRINTGFQWTYANATISIWFQTVAGQSYAGGLCPISNYHSGGTVDLEIYTDSNKMHAYARDTGNHAISAAGVHLINDNVWHHFAIVLNGTTLTSYLDGVQEGTGTNASFNGNVAGYNLYVGSNYDGTLLWKGYLEDARFYSQPLTVNQIQSLASSRTRLSITDNLVAYYPLDDSTNGYVISNGTIVLDRSGNGKNGTASCAGTTFVWSDSSWLSYP